MLTGALKLGRDRVISLCGAGGKTTLMFSLAREFAAAGEKVLITTTTKLAMAECQDRFPVFKAGSAGEILRRACFGPGAIVVHAGQSENSEKLIGFSRGVIDAVSAAGVFDRILIEADGSRRRPLKAPDAREPVFADTTDAVVIVAGLNGIGKVLCAETTFRAEIWSRLSGLKIGDIITPDSVARVIVHCDGAARRCPDGAKRVVFLNRADSPRALRHARQIMRVLPGLAGRHPVHTVAGYLLPAPGIVDPV
jgi:probable selenium-dependent hydroxylase accessory protein YqeC